MRVLSSFFLIFIFAQPLFAQKTPTTELVNEFLNSKTYIVLEGSLFSSYNIYLKAAIDNEWKITPSEIISYSEFQKKRKMPNTSFLVVTNVQFNNDKTGTTYDFLNLLLGGNYRGLDDMPDLVNLPLSLAGQDGESYVYKLSALIRFIQIHIQNLKDNPELTNKDFKKIFKANNGNFKDKTIYLLKEELAENINSMAKLKKAYPYSIKISNKEEIEKLIETKQENAVFLHIVGPDKPTGNRMCFKVLMGADNAQIYYYGHHTVSSKKESCLLKKDLQKIAKTK